MFLYMLLLLLKHVIQYMQYCFCTCMFHSTDAAYRYSESDEEANLPMIPALPIGYDFAEILLR